MLWLTNLLWITPYWTHACCCNKRMPRWGQVFQKKKKQEASCLYVAAIEAMNLERGKLTGFDVVDEGVIVVLGGRVGAVKDLEEPVGEASVDEVPLSDQGLEVSPAKDHLLQGLPQRRGWKAVPATRQQPHLK